MSACRSYCRVEAGRTLEDSDGSGEVVDSTGGLEGGNDDRGSGNEIVGEGVVQVTLLHNSVRDNCDQPRLAGWNYLELENILDTLEFLLVSGLKMGRQQLTRIEPLM